MASTVEVEAMRRAFTLAASDPAPTHPNPRVGAVVLDRRGEQVGEGFHRGAGQPHAEIEALSAAAGRAAGGTAVVTLEPCHHTGRTGPCTAALITAGLRRVVFAQSDPNPLARGGADALRRAGLDVEGGVLEPQARSLNLAWSLAMERQRPYLIWKSASTLDGRAAAADRSSRWITGPGARAEVHRLRARAHAIVVGTGTVLDDDPRLTARDDEGRPCRRQPLRVVVGMRDLQPSAQVCDEAAPTLHLRTRSPHEVLDTLFARDVHHAVIEGGPTLASAFVDAGLVDQAVGYVAPMLLGNGPAVFESVAATTLSDARRFAFDDVRLVAGDLRWRARLSEAPMLDLEGTG